jgi:hypothetical protein
MAGMCFDVDFIPSFCNLLLVKKRRYCQESTIAFKSLASVVAFVVKKQQATSFEFTDITVSNKVKCLNCKEKELVAMQNAMPEARSIPKKGGWVV